MSDATGLRERKKTETRRLIAEAALELATERGPDDITVEDIAAAADVAPRTVFNHFGTKDEAILGISEDRRLAMVAALAARPADEAPLDALASVLLELMTSSNDTGRFWMARARLVHQHPHLRAAQLRSQEALEHDLATVIADRTGLDVDRDPYPRLVATLTLAAVRLALARAGDRGARVLRREMETALELLGGGLVASARSGR
jgi:AcrR family transcriptional regulator